MKDKREIRSLIRNEITAAGIASGDMLKSTYDPNADGVIALAQLDTAVSTFKQTDHDALANPHHANTNDPSADQKAALAGTSGTPSVTNKYVTDSDARNANARTPSAHNNTYHSETYITVASVTDANLSTSDVTTNDVSTSKHGLCPKAPNDTSKFLRGDATWAAPAGSSLDIHGLTEETTPATDDEVPIYDTSASANRKMSRTNFFK